MYDEIEELGQFRRQILMKLKMRDDFHPNKTLEVGEFQCECDRAGSILFWAKSSPQMKAKLCHHKNDEDPHFWVADEQREVSVGGHMNFEGYYFKESKKTESEWPRMDMVWDERGKLKKVDIELNESVKVQCARADDFNVRVHFGRDFQGNCCVVVPPRIKEGMVISGGEVKMQINVQNKFTNAINRSKLLEFAAACGIAI